MILDENDVMQLSLFNYEPVETELVKNTVKKNDITIDVGANIGYYTLLMAKNNAIVHSYEPEPYNFDLLSKSTFPHPLHLYNPSSKNILYSPENGISVAAFLNTS